MVGVFKATAPGTYTSFGRLYYNPIYHYCSKSVDNKRTGLDFRTVLALR